MGREVNGCHRLGQELPSQLGPSAINVVNSDENPSVSSVLGEDLS